MEEIVKPVKSKIRKIGISKETLNLVRTTYRNNVDLTNIADNKANILLTLNSLMLTILLPTVISNFDLIRDFNFQFPIIILSLTSLASIVIAALATRPIKIEKQRIVERKDLQISPFYFGNYYKMKVEDYLNLLEESFSDPSHIKEHIMMDLYFMGKGLGVKYNRIRLCYNVFIIGILLTAIATFVVLLLG